MSFVEVLCNSRLNHTGCDSLAGLGRHGKRHGFAGRHRVTQPWLPARSQSLSHLMSQSCSEPESQPLF